MTAKTEIITISIFFLILFTADSSYDAIVTHMFQKLKLPDVGPSSLAAMYLAFCFSLIMAPALKIPLKTQILLSAVAYPANFIFGLIASLCECKDTTYLLVCTGTVLNGLGAGVIWTSQGRYMHLVAEIFRVDKDRGQLFALFTAFYCIALLLGACVTFLGLGYFSNTIYFLILIGISFMAILFGITFIRNIEQIGVQQIQNLQIQRIQQNKASIQKIENLLKKQRENSQQTQYNIKQSLKKFIFFIPYMRCLLPIFVIIAIMVGVKSNLIIHLIPKSLKPETFNKFAGLSQILSKLGTIIGGYLQGYMYDAFGSITVGRIGLVLFFLGCWTHILTFLIQNLVLAMVMAFIWGFIMRFIFALLPIICSKYYGGRSESFALTKLFPSLFTALFQVAMIITKNKVNPQVFVGFSLLVIPAFYWFRNIETVYKCQVLQDQKLMQESINTSRQ